MRKYILLLIFVFVSIGTYAQKTVATTLSQTQTLVEISNPLVASDSLHTGSDSTFTWTIRLNKAVDLLYDVQVELDSLSGTPDYDVDLKYKVFENDSWSDAETDVTWDGTSSDTTITFTEHTTAIFATQLQLQVNGQASTGGAKVSKLSLKLYE